MMMMIIMMLLLLLLLMMVMMTMITKWEFWHAVLFCALKLLLHCKYLNRATWKKSFNLLFKTMIQNNRWRSFFVNRPMMLTHPDNSSATKISTKEGLFYMNLYTIDSCIHSKDSMLGVELSWLFNLLEKYLGSEHTKSYKVSCEVYNISQLCWV